ncbi:uncharacterized protein LOC131223974 [Magnolia sinica]|uniref:uncharacterized protein LOC131223974 n=1 Tax=Magnolia sinica TaxID=86752 RepID=UPI00265AB323|nr:uncharacterized protein LOC131223974 [Magnolia sinica]
MILSHLPALRRSFSSLSIRPILIKQINPPMNSGIVKVPKGRVFMLERMEKYHKILPPGFHFLIPIIDNISFVHCVGEYLMSFPNQTAIIKDYVRVSFDAVCSVKMIDPYLASYANVTNRSVDVLADMLYTLVCQNVLECTFDEAVMKRTALNKNAITKVNETAGFWVYQFVRYEITRFISPEFEADREMSEQAKRRGAIKDFDHNAEIKRVVAKA